MRDVKNEESDEGTSGTSTIRWVTQYVTLSHAPCQHFEYKTNILVEAGTSGHVILSCPWACSALLECHVKIEKNTVPPPPSPPALHSLPISPNSVIFTRSEFTCVCVCARVCVRACA